MLYQPAYAAVKGEGGYSWTNCISMNNKGLEAVAGWRDKIGKDFGYEITVNGSLYKNKITDLPTSLWYTFGGGTIDNSIVGQPLGSWMGYVTDGVFQTQAEVNEYKSKYDVQLGAPGVGRIKYVDVNGDGKISTSDQKWLGTDNPKFIGGLNLACSYKGFDLSLFFNGMTDTIAITHLSNTHHFVRIENAHRYLLLPVEESADNARIKLIVNNETTQTIIVRLAVNKIDYFVPFDLKSLNSKQTLLDITFINESARQGGANDYICWKKMSCCPIRAQQFGCECYRQ